MHARTADGDFSLPDALPRIREYVDINLLMKQICERAAIHDITRHLLTFSPQSSHWLHLGCQDSHSLENGAVLKQ